MALQPRRRLHACGRESRVLRVAGLKSKGCCCNLDLELHFCRLASNSSRPEIFRMDQILDRNFALSFKR